MALTRAPPVRASAAQAAYLAFVLSVYASAAQLVPALAPLAPGQTLITLATASLLASCLLYRHSVTLPTIAGGGALYLFFGILVVSPLWSLWPHLSLQAAAEAGKYLVPFVVSANVLCTRTGIRRAAGAISVASLFPAIGAIHGYLTGTRLVEGTRAVWIGAFGNPNFLAYHLVVSVPLALALRDSVAARAPTRWLFRVFWLGVVVCLSAAILLTGSRGGTLGLGAVLLLWTARGLARGRLALGAVLSLLVALVMTPGGPWTRQDTRKTLSGELDASAKGRVDAWRTALRMVADRPLTGVGIGAFVLGYERYAPGDAGPARTAHNSFLMIAAELGLPALLCFVLSLYCAFHSLGQAARAPSARASPGAVSVDPNQLCALVRGLQTALFGFVVCSFTGGYSFSWPLYFVLGLGVATVRCAETQ